MVEAISPPFNWQFPKCLAR